MNNQNGTSIYFNRQLHALQAWISKRQYRQAIKALEFTQSLYTGTRKDGCTPAFAHQLAVAYGVRVVSAQLKCPEDALCAAFLHDVCEDHSIAVGVLRDHFGPSVAEAVWVLTKKFAGQHKNIKDYYQQLSSHPIAAVVKGADRIHNLQTMQGVFDADKQYRYIQETDALLLPALRQAGMQFPGESHALQRIEAALVDTIDGLQSFDRHAGVRAVFDLEQSLQATESKDISYTLQQDEFMTKLGSSGVLDYSYFNETPSIALKLDLPAIKRLAKIREVSQVIPAPDNSLLFEQ